MSYKIKLESFEGPLDLLLHLIEKAEIDIYNIPVSEITRQYLKYIEEMQRLDMEVASEFLVMAATLLEIKSKMLLPDTSEEQLEFDVEGMDPRRDLVQKLIEYRKYKNIAEFLKQREELYGKVYFKQQEDLEQFIDSVNLNKFNLDMDSEVLAEAIKRIIKKADKIDTKRGEFFKELKREIYTVEDKIKVLKEKIQNSKVVNFIELFSENCCRLEVVVTFLALLELLKLKVIAIKQNGLFEDIYIYEAN